MIKNAGIALFTALFCIPSLAATPVTLRSGINSIDLNRDGLMDSVLVAEFDNNTSHPNMGLTFFVRTPEKTHNIMPVANSNLFTWFDFRLSADAGFLVQDNRLFTSGRHYFLVSALKKGDNLYESTPVELRVYRFTESRDDPGVPRYDWTLIRTMTSREKHLSADGAFAELKGVELSK